MSKEVVVTGYALVAPMAMDAERLFINIIEKRSGIRQHPAFAELGFANIAAGYIDEYQWLEIATRIGIETPLIPRQSVLAEYVARQAVRHAGLTSTAFSEVPSGVFLGSNKHCASRDLQEASRYMDASGSVDLDRYLDNHMLVGGPFFRRVDEQTQHVARLLGIRDYVSTHSDACAAGTMAIGAAFRAIERGEIELALCGAVELMAHELSYYSFDGLGAICPRFDLAPEQQSRPFMSDRCGFVLSEGSAMIVLESRQHAERRRAAVLGRVLGYSNFCEAQKITSSSRDGLHYAYCMNAALENAGLSPDAIDHVNTHGTSTQANDRSEALALRKVFGTGVNTMTFTANKSAIGHSLAASGAIEAVLSLMSLQQGVLLPTLNYDPANAEFPDLNFLSEALHEPVHVVLSNSFGFGGVNSSLILGGA